MMNSKARGFTLLEVMITMSLMGLLMVLIASTLTLSNRTLSISEYYSTRLSEIRSAQSFIRKSLQQSLPIVFLRDGKNTDWIFDGERQQLRFVAPMPPPLLGGVKIHSIELADNDEASSNLQVSFRQTPTQGVNAWGEPQILLQNVQNLRISYRGLDNNQRVTNWLENWPWPERLPQYIKVDLDTQGPISWPQLVVAIRLSPMAPIDRITP
ncbi:MULTISPECIES: prepilin-type N-terminal cleavage/methylation domain-containing protein [unclassified Pseudomonas]|uniref:prepilin-type N-terminal cleavage/methylation domain-containing protein n=1 Tax=unclassified Pseudomonas TaxID=196821 RepID=UPI002A371C52|nr:MULTISPECIES: prepilin-type N-terminal cleavage/methylation domain-containing protein [unclassified Pseudomonas]MDX9669576.1 prepilin-type N-terminal cleavage/methylation domain-containing protein [Pseudomonas sp. P8_250]WPN36388.1 prepilin-type N-terminal cleavage/methylation domain-containing protein [Pseudomonas sp. P8_139]WPN41811.1 prepilin-type N-terminal cleavage/methylation domain-containing protein [Pseudomonas sp. P8_229]